MTESALSSAAPQIPRCSSFSSAVFQRPQRGETPIMSDSLQLNRLNPYGFLHVRDCAWNLAAHEPIVS
ncbi:hypothetical protein B1400_0319 [Bifidobacterium italicum]|uniref:Uncharacterized protein n=1 Tax=Bifidobacterium italicum TaxID=1960968 RepID=A0A2A2EKN5_9BIFI|nr:hypothetical protein [Bifidobacterium italicum]PAU69784.1 hypothetical protein B1400_0319 [Bifidobacterium italicum]